MVDDREKNNLSGQEFCALMSHKIGKGYKSIGEENGASKTIDASKAFKYFALKLMI